MLFVTVAAANYVPKAIFLARTIKDVMPDSTIVICLVEQSMDSRLTDSGVFDRIILASDLNIDNFDVFVFRHDVIEACTAIKAQLLIDLLNECPDQEEFVYLDPDIWVFGKFDELSEAFQRSDIVVTPHHLDDEETCQGVEDNVLRTLQCGIFNLGFLGVKRSDETLRFLEWWNSRLRMMCFIDFERGLFVDQKWMDLAISFFDLHVLREAGYNVANWNISHRHISEGDQGQLTVNGAPLRFFHFSDIDSGKDKRILKAYAPSANAVVHRLREEYKNEIRKLGGLSFFGSPWSYDFFESGERITKLARIACRRNQKLLEQFDRPFQESNETFLSYGWMG